MEAMVATSTLAPDPSLGPRSVALPADLPLALWCVTLEGDATLDLEQLSAEERLRASRFVHRRDARRFVLAHAALRRLLAAELGCDASDVAIVVDPGGKPRLQGGELEFSLSRSDGFALVALSSTLEVGVDLEAIRPTAVDAIVSRFFTAGEREALASLSAERRQAAAYQCWTRKEAYVKGTGEGIAGASLADADVGIGGCRQMEDWTIRDVGVPDGFAAAIASRARKAARGRQNGWDPGG